ncbi:glycosyltransferase N-terminal domain-containing protein [Cognatiyoonia sp. IB215446]|uniref:3-deoxy-D-manno-octulosonic acid transferase n=1 Tax=Cognatiyoonia sp. IB215446 TaxID=3097355 RepID=UPI002A1364A0|nr:glycosyltransferase N-terminal domain-containing protein [Cognatiyoonia sp. IB215446]MDX8347315.1 glycosyltransferase N-terminal domain-containing protein [Cognatiyoonia sp. IB215446]
MMPRSKMHRGVLLRLYLFIAHLVPMIAPSVLRRRLRKGKEHPKRWPEKQGRALAARPEGTLIWLHAVGLGEVMSLRGLIARLTALQPDVQVLVTSTTAASAEVFVRNLPPRTLHQFLPLDAPLYRKRFLDHFKPNLCIWVEQDIWPGFVHDLHRDGVPQAMVATRMNAESFRLHQKAAKLYRDLYGVMAMITAQDDASATHLRRLGAGPSVSGSLKPAAPALACDGAVLERLRDALQNRWVWAVAPSHPDDEQIAIAAHDIVTQADPTALLIIAPRYPERRDEITAQIGGNAPIRSRDEIPSQDDRVWLCDTFGEMGLIYRLARAILVGGTFGPVAGHNPWEAAALDTAIFHGPQTANFAHDFEVLDSAGGALKVDDAEALATALMHHDQPELAQNARDCIAKASAQTDKLAQDLVALLRPA